MTETCKRCFKCKTEKPASEFHKDRRSKDGLQGRCKECNKLLNAAFKAKNPDYHKEHGKAKYHSIEDKKAYNKERYQAHQEGYIRRRREYGATVRGRANGLLTSARLRAAKEHLQFDLDLDWLLQKFAQQECTCVLTGLPFSFAPASKANLSYNPFSPSLDKIDPTQGYTKNNTRLVCTAINIALGEWGEDVFEQVAISLVSKKETRAEEMLRKVQTRKTSNCVQNVNGIC